MSQSTVPANAPSPAPHQHDGEFLNYSEFIERQLGKTRGQVKSVELFSELLVLVVGSVSYLLAVVLFDHWIITGGLGTASRLFACGVLAVGAGVFFWVRILPLLLREINPIYAADTIERSTPTLKNSLINFLMLRGNQSPMTKLVYEAIEERAATDLSNVPVEGVVDRTRMIKIFYVLMALVAFGCVYKLASPKDPIRSVGRVIFPWTDMAAPTRVTIEEVKPGTAQAFLGSTVTVKALISGLKADETATLYYSTEDGSVVDQAVPLALREGMQHEARLPPDAEGSTTGLGQSLRYYLAAGDFRTVEYRLEVVPPPTIVVESIEYDFPSYTGMPRRVVKNQGDLKALEGTRVVVRAATNQMIQSGTALLDLDSDGQPPTLALRNEGDDGKHVWGAFELRLQKDGTPQHESYLLRYRNSDGTLNPNPIRHRIEVIADLAPTVEFTAPAKDVELPANQVLELALRAADQDFALRQVFVRIQLREKDLYPAVQSGGDPGLPLIDSGTPAKLETKHVLDPRKLGLAAGDEVVYWATAIDTKKPNNTPVDSQRWRVKIVSPAQAGPNELAKNDPPQDDPRNQDPKNQPNNQNPKNNNTGGQKNPGDPKNQEGNPPPQGQEGNPDKNPAGGQNPPGAQDPKNPNPDPKNGNQPSPANDEKSEPVNPDQDPSRAFEKIREHQAKNDPPEKKPPEKKQPEKPDQGKQGSEDKGSKKNDGGGSGKQQGDDKKGKQDGDKQGSEQGSQKKGDSGSGKQDGKQESGKQESGKQESGKQPGKEQGSESGGKQENGKQDGKKDAGKQGSGSEKGNEKRGSDNKQGSGDKQGNSGDKQGSEQGKSGKQPGDEKGNSQEKGNKSEGNSTEKKTPGETENGNSAGKKGGEGATAKKDDKNGTETEEGPRPGDPNDKGGATQKGEGETKQGVPKKEGSEKKTPGDEKGEDEGGARDKQSGGTDKKGQNQDGGPTPEAQGKQDAKNKTGKPDQDNKTGNEKGEEGKSPANGDKNADSKAGEGGDKKGNGEKGGGQNSNQAGQGGAGQNTESETGGKAGNEAGDGEKTNRAGDKAPAAGKTGKSGSDQPGEGSKSAPKPKGEGSGKNPEQTGEKGEAGKQGQQNSSQGDPKGEGGKAGTGKPQGKTDTGESGPGQGNPVQGGNRDGDREHPGKSDPSLNDPVNLNDAIEGVDLALKHLKDELEKPNPDQKLLDGVGGSREKAQQFYDRWKKMRDDALKGGAENSDARKRFEESLRGLGLSGGTAKADNRGAKFDDLRGRGTTVVPPPPNYRDRTSGFRTGISKPTPETK